MLKDKYLTCDSLFGMMFDSLFLPVRDLEPEASDGIAGVYNGIPFRAVPEVRKVYFNNRHTTIEWADGVKTTVGCIEGQEFSEYGGFAAAVLKRLYGSSREAVQAMNAKKEVQCAPVRKTRRAGEEGQDEKACQH